MFSSIPGLFYLVDAKSTPVVVTKTSPDISTCFLWGKVVSSWAPLLQTLLLHRKKIVPLDSEVCWRSSPQQDWGWKRDVRMLPICHLDLSLGTRPRLWGSGVEETWGCNLLCPTLPTMHTAELRGGPGPYMEGCKSPFPAGGALSIMERLTDRYWIFTLNWLHGQINQLVAVWKKGLWQN